MSRTGLATRAANPFSVRVANDSLTTRSDKIYEDLEERVLGAIRATAPERDLKVITEALDTLRTRTQDERFESAHFGEVLMLKMDQLVINVDNQRDVDWDHVAYIIANFDPRIVQVINVIRLRDGTYSIPEGQHTAVALFILLKKGMLPADFEVACKVVDYRLAVPGSVLTGEGFGNLLFRIINHKGRKGVEPFYLHRSRVSGVRLYNSELQEDVHSEQIQQVLENNSMFPAPAVSARGHGATPGMVTYINGLNAISEHDTAQFDASIADLDWALRCHSQEYGHEKGVDGGFILAFGRYAKLARKLKIRITGEHRQELLDFFREKYGSPRKFHAECKKRLKNFQRKHMLNESWSDTALLSILILDFAKYCDDRGLTYPVLIDPNLNKYTDI